MRKKIFRRTLATLLTVMILMTAAIVHAEIYTGEGSYIMSEGENLGVAKERAKADAMRNAAEKAGTYVRSYSRAKNFVLEEDIIETMTSNILKLIGEPNFLPYEQLDNLEGLLIRVIVKVEVDDSDINRWLNKNEQEKSTLVAQNEALRKANEQQERQIAELKRRLAQSTTQQDKERIAQDFAAEDKIFLSNQKFDEAVKLYGKGDLNGVIQLCTEAITLNPNNSLAYYGRGTAYDESGQYENAIKDYNKSVEINPSFADAYYNRGNTYSNLNNHERAIIDYNVAIQLNPNYASAYYNCGNAYYYLQQYERAIQDYDKAIKLNPNYTGAYNNRGNAYQILKQYKRAIQDFNKAIELKPNYADAYYNRGNAYYNQQQYERAIKDYDKAIELKPNYVEVYNNRGIVYAIIGNFKQSIIDFNKAIELKPNLAKAYYVRGLTYQKFGDEAKAQADFAKAKELGYNG